LRTFGRSLAAGLAAIAVLMVVGCTSQPVAIVNGQRITKQEFYDRLEQAGGDKVLADLIARRLLTDAFDKSGLKLTQQDIDAEIAKLKKQAPSEAEWQQFLKQQGLTEATLREQLTFNLKVRKMSEQGVQVTDAALQQEFTKYRQDFDRPETVLLSEIVLSDKAKADSVRAQLNDPKASFQTLARQDSMSTYTRERGGLRAEEPLSGVQPEALREAVKGLQVGQVSQPIKADDVWYIVKLEQRNAAQAADFAKIKDKVRDHYMSTHAKDPQAMVEELRKTARVKILAPKYAEMQKLFGPAQALPSFGAPTKGGDKAPAGVPGTAAPAAGQQPAAPAPPAGQQPAAPAPAPAPAPAK
jgi:foldase protein PrsA